MQSLYGSAEFQSRCKTILYAHYTLLPSPPPLFFFALTFYSPSLHFTARRGRWRARVHVYKVKLQLKAALYKPHKTPGSSNSHSYFVIFLFREMMYLYDTVVRCFIWFDRVGIGLNERDTEVFLRKYFLFFFYL